MTVDRRFVWPLALFGLLAVVGGVALGWGEAGVLWDSGTAMQAPASQERAPASQDETAPIAFSDVTEEAGLGAFRHETGAVGNKWFPEAMGAGGGFIDYNGDGHLDILLVGGGTWEGEPAPPAHRALWLYRNDGDGTFTLRTEEAGLGDVTAYGFGVTVANHDNDGDPDFYLTTLNENELFRNDDSTFTESLSVGGEVLSNSGQPPASSCESIITVSGGPFIPLASHVPNRDCSLILICLLILQMKHQFPLPSRAKSEGLSPS